MWIESLVGVSPREVNFGQRVLSGLIPTYTNPRVYTGRPGGLPLLSQRRVDDLAGFLLDLGQVLRALETLGVNLVNIFCS